MILPKFDPVFLNLGVVQIRWYAISYILGIIIGWHLAAKIAKRYKLDITSKNLTDYISWVIVSILLGGRIGYIIFYQFEYYYENPREILKIYHGGLSFQGALITYIIATYIFAKKNNLNFATLLDLSALVAPIGLFLGRIANLINSELYGRVTKMPWGVIYPSVDFKTRHPSQIYEALLEGVTLFIILNYLNRKYSIIKREFYITSLFLILYSLFRIYVEFYRTPDPQIGLLYKYFTLGQVLSSFMLILGVLILNVQVKNYKK